MDAGALPSWRDGADFVAPADRVATFDNHGTLWCEQPMQVQGFFLQQRLRELADADPTMKERQPFKAFLEHEREFAYDREFRLSPLVEALDRAAEYGIMVVSMRNDWAGVYAD